MKGKKSYSHFRNCLSLSSPVVKSRPQCSKSHFPSTFYAFRILYKKGFYRKNGESGRALFLLFLIFLLLPIECFLCKLLLSPRDKLEFFFLLGLTFGVVVLIVLFEHAETLGRPLPDQVSYISILQP